jgi:hypothetical protein
MADNDDDDDEDFSKGSWLDPKDLNDFCQAHPLPPGVALEAVQEYQAGVDYDAAEEKEFAVIKEQAAALLNKWYREDTPKHVRAFEEDAFFARWDFKRLEEPTAS